MSKRRSSPDLFNFILQLRNKFIEITDQWQKRTGNKLMFPREQAKGLKILLKLYKRFGKADTPEKQKFLLAHDDKDIPPLYDFADWLVGKAAELTGKTNVKPFPRDPRAFIASDDQGTIKGGAPMAL